MALRELRCERVLERGLHRYRRGDTVHVKIIVAGSRSLIVEPKVIQYHLEMFRQEKSLVGSVEIVSGCAPGVDKSGERFAREHHLPLHEFPADWGEHGKAAGDIRNEKMGRFADAALLFFKQRPSPGTSNMLAWMHILKKPYKVVIL